MAADLALSDNRIKSALIMLPAMGVMIWLASEVASEDILVPAIVLALFVVTVIFSVFVRSIRFEVAVTGFLLCGYLIGNRGFADLTIAKPFYPGEIGLGVIILALLLRYIITRETIDLQGWTARAIMVYLALGAVRLGIDFRKYGIISVRDSAMVYYSLFFFLGRHFGRTQGARQFFEKCLSFCFLALVPIALIARLAPQLLLSGGGSYMTMFFQKDDLLGTFLAVGVFFIYTRPHVYRPRWIRPVIILFFISFLATGISRASIAAVAIGSIVMFLARQRRFFLYPVAAIVLGITVLAGLSIRFEGSEVSSPSVMLDQFMSMVDVTGGSFNERNEHYSTDVGQLKASTNDFRRQLWASYVDETLQNSPIFGMGFGYDLGTSFLGNEEASGLRSAHNYYVSLFGRMGFIGILAFGVITWRVIAGGLQAVRAVRQHEMPLRDLGYWAGVWGILISATFGVVLEGPIGAIVFWLLFGLAVAGNELAAKNAAEEAVEETEFLPVSELPARPARRYTPAFRPPPDTVARR